MSFTVTYDLAGTPQSAVHDADKLDINGPWIRLLKDDKAIAVYTARFTLSIVRNQDPEPERARKAK